MDASTALQVFVSPLLGVVFENLSSLIQKEIGLVLGVSKELDKLYNILVTIQDVLEEAEVKQIDDKPINNWLRKLKDLVYEADDILDECATEALIPESDIQVTSPSDSSCFDFKGIMFRRSIGKRIKNLMEKFDEMAKLRRDFHLNLTPKQVESGSNDHRETSSTLTEPQVYGRDEEKEHIVNQLLKGGDEVSVCCIMGMGGLGKTTLAQLVYNDENITKNFQLKCWVCVSDDFILKKLLKSIIQSTSGKACDLDDLDPLERRVEEILSGKRFLLVLDDVWNENQTKWNKLKSLLACGGKGSSIIVTTRLQSVALMTRTLPIWHLEAMSEENCWSLFKYYAFNMENNEYHQKFEEIGKEIVKKCRGVPLAAKALGALLSFKKTEDEWLIVRDNALWDLEQDKELGILSALRLSYNHLSSTLKQCFSYCSIFPKDYEMVKEELIHLWMANGFIRSKGGMGLEDIGNLIFNELLWRSFFQEARKDKDGDIVNCKMHDLVHDLACSIMVNECRVMEVVNNENTFKRSTRHLSLDCSRYLSPSTNISNSFVSQSLRTFLLLGDPMFNRLVQRLLYSNLKFLRVLDLHSFDSKKLPVSIGNLKHLRYLDLSNCRDMRSLPESICNLRNLQVLKLDHCRRLKVLPVNMRKLTNLRHLGMKECDALRQMPVGMGSLSCLRTLSMFIVMPKSGCGITELQGLDHLTGELTIKGLEHVRNSKDAKDANLMRKKNLRVLSLFWSERNNGTIEEKEEEELALVGEGLRPHSNIKKLYLEFYNGLKFPSWMSHSCLPNLIKISLVGCRRCEHLPTLGKLPLLEVLRISEIDSLKCIGDEFYGDHHPRGSFFPSLKSLGICNMPNLEEWNSQSSSKEEVFTSLESLDLKGCFKLRSMPRLSPSLKTLKLTMSNEIKTLPGVMQNLTSLKVLEIGWCNSLKCLPELGSRNTVLTKLKIEYCDGLTSVSDCLRHLTALEDLSISGCPELEFLPDDFQDLTSLRSLDISFLPQMACLPEGLQQVAGTLKSLDIFGCSGLTSLPEWMDKFTSLRSLSIGDCHPDLHRRYAKETDEDWHKIAHIPLLYISEEYKFTLCDMIRNPCMN